MSKAKSLLDGRCLSLLLISALGVSVGVSSIGASTAADDVQGVKDVAQVQTIRVEPAPMAKAAPIAGQSSAKSETNKVLMISAAEKISIKSPEFPMLSGEYRIADDSTVSLPIVGRFSIKNFSPADFEFALAEELQRISSRESHVTVEIVDYKPVFVTGYVARAGSSPWKPGYTVMHAEALAGGIYRPVEANSAFPAESEKTRAVRAASDLARVVVQLARMTAEKAGEGQVSLSPEILELVPQAEAEKLVAAQNTMLSSRRAAYDAQLKSLQHSQELAEQEVGGLKEQLARIDEQLGLRRDYKNRVGDMVKKGFVRYERSLDELSRVSDIEEKRTNVVVALSRIHSALATLTRDLVVIQQDRTAALDMEIIKTEREASQLKIDVETSRAAFRKMTGREALGGVKPGSGSAQPAMIYEIVRTKDGVPTTIRADWLTSLEPGDLVVVRVEEVGTQ